MARHPPPPGGGASVSLVKNNFGQNFRLVRSVKVPLGRADFGFVSKYFGVGVALFGVFFRGQNFDFARNFFGGFEPFFDFIFGGRGDAIFAKYFDDFSFGRGKFGK